MFIFDLVPWPLRKLIDLCERIQEAADGELAKESAHVVAQLQDLHRALESGSISLDEFEARERSLLDRLEEIDSSSDGEED